MSSFGKTIFFSKLSHSYAKFSFALQFVHCLYRVIIAVTTALLAVFPQTYLLALSSQQYSRSQGPLCWSFIHNAQPASSEKKM